MSQKEKLITKLKSNPKDFTFDELEQLLNYFGYSLSNKGRTSGSRIMFTGKNRPPILLHKPPGRKELLSYQVSQIIDMLKEEGLI